MTAPDSRPAKRDSTPNVPAPAGPDSPQAIDVPSPKVLAPAGTEDSRPAIPGAMPTGTSPAGPDSLGGHSTSATHASLAAEGQTSPQASVVSIPNDATPAGGKTSRSHSTRDDHGRSATADNFPGGHLRNDAHGDAAAGEPPPDPPPAQLLAPWPDELNRDLAAAADTLDDIEKMRIACENRLRQFTRAAGEPDADGRKRGFGWDLRSPAVAALATLVAGMKCDSTVVREALGDERPPKRKGCCLEHDAERNLTRALRGHPLGPWVKTRKGIGEKQGGRLIGAIGDPYARPALLLKDGSWDPARPRTVSELWAYCGLKPGQKRKRGERANWSAAAKMRAFNVAGSMLKAGNREVYDKRKARTEGALHKDECVRCGPKGKPAQPGSLWSNAHRHADALRIVSKEVLKGLRNEAKRIHLETPVSGQNLAEPHGTGAADGD